MAFLCWESKRMCGNRLIPENKQECKRFTPHARLDVCFRSNITQHFISKINIYLIYFTFNICISLLIIVFALSTILLLSSTKMRLFSWLQRIKYMYIFSNSFLLIHVENSQLRLNGQRCGLQFSSFRVRFPPRAWVPVVVRNPRSVVGPGLMSPRVQKNDRTATNQSTKLANCCYFIEYILSVTFIILSLM